jgi:hypothetical protein
MECASWKPLTRCPGPRGKLLILRRIRLSRQPCSATPAPLRSRYTPQFTVLVSNFPSLAEGWFNSLCPIFWPPSREITSSTLSALGGTERPEIANELCPPIQASVQASQPLPPRRVQNLCRASIEQMGVLCWRQARSGAGEVYPRPGGSDLPAHLRGQRAALAC